MTYACAECGAPVTVDEDGTAHRTCAHVLAPIVAELEAHCTGSSELK